MGEEWLQGEDANDAAEILQKAGLGKCIHQVLLPPPSQQPLCQPSCTTGHAVIYALTKCSQAVLLPEVCNVIALFRDLNTKIPPNITLN